MTALADRRERAAPRAAMLLGALLLGAPCAPLPGQAREDVTFEIEPGYIDPDRSVYVLGDLPELGGDELVRAVKLAKSGSSWRVRISLPAGASYAYRFYDRGHDMAEVGDPTNGKPLGPVQHGSTSAAPSGGKRFRCQTDIRSPRLFWRQGDGEFTRARMRRIARGRARGESRYEVKEFAARGRPVEFYVTDARQRQRDPEDGTYVTPLDAIFLQDGELFGYEPAAEVAAQRRDYEPAKPPSIESKALGETRAYRVVLPRGYDQHVDRRYPVLYAHDGWLWFDAGPSSVDRDAELLAGLTRQGEVGELIVVGIDHADRTDQKKFFRNRVRDFVPPGDFGLTPFGAVAGAGDRYLAFVETELKPLIDAKYRTLPDRDHTWTVGFSAGAVAAMHFSWDSNATFSRLGSFAGQFETPKLLDRIARGPKRDLRIYLDSGTVNDYYASALRIYDALIGRSEPWVVERELRFAIGIGQTHTPTDVAKRFGGFLRFLYPGNEEGGGNGR